MKTADIVNHLSRVIPKHTSGFSDSVAITSIIPSGNVATVTATAHGAIENQNVAITGAEAPVQIDTPTFIRTGSTAIFRTLQDHDLTLSERDKANGGKTLTISGATEAEFNGVFSIVRVVNRRELIIAVTDSGSTTISGAPLVENANGGLFNGIFQVYNVTTNTFDYTLPISYPLPASGAPLAQTSIRILAVLDINQYMTQVYTKQAIGKNQLIVVMGDTIRNKKQTESTDAYDSSVGEDSYTPKFIQQFAIYIVQNTSSMVAAATARDNVEGEYVPAVLRSVERAKFDTGFTYSQFRSICTQHGVFGYDAEVSKGRAVYIHEMVFQQLATIDKVMDTYNEDDSVALRDIDYTMTTDKGTGVLLADINMDDIPLVPDILYDVDGSPLIDADGEYITTNE